MLINTILVDHLKAQGLPVRLIPDRDIGDYSWAELTQVHPKAAEAAAEMLGYRFIATMEEFAEGFTPHLSPAAGESDFDYDARMESYLSNACFPAKVGATIITDRSNTATVWVALDPFTPLLDSVGTAEIIMAPAELVNTILRGNRSESSVIAPYSDSEPIDAWINKLITAAYNQGAADVEITSHVSAIKIRFKIMGRWTDWLSSLPLAQRGALLRTLCASATPSLDYEPGTDHDFKIERRILGTDTSWRGSITPAALGDSVTLRMLPGIGRIPLLEELGYSERACALLRKAASRKDGLVLMTGSTGHGKTTTLYSLMTEIRDQNRKVFSAESPIEMIVPGAVQKAVVDGSNIDEKYRVTFASAIRTALRHAPDVLVVGETRDRETAHAAVSASRTGHLTYTTLHTNSVRVAVKRMLDLGIDPISLADTLLLVVSQNLVGKLCPHCKIEHEDGTCSRNHQGCVQCSHRGYLGRTVVYEMVSLDDAAREAIIDGRFEDHFPRLADIGQYIGKREIAEKLISSGTIDARDVEGFL